MKKTFIILALAVIALTVTVFASVSSSAIVPVVAEVSIGDEEPVPFYSFDEALEYARSATFFVANVTLYQDVTIENYVSLQDVRVNLNLNGHYIYSSGFTVFQISGLSEVTINATAGGGAEATSPGSNCFVITDNAFAIINGGVYRATASVINMSQGGLSTNATVYINGGRFVSPEHFGVIAMGSHLGISDAEFDVACDIVHYAGTIDISMDDPSGITIDNSTGTEQTAEGYGLKEGFGFAPFDYEYDYKSDYETSFPHFSARKIVRKHQYTTCTCDESCPITPFSDVVMDKWYHDSIHFCLERDLMNGVTPSTFRPNVVTTRAMMVYILWNLEGNPQADYEMTFEDVEEGKWYTPAVRWAASEGIVAGYSATKFGPNDIITREQMAMILYNYAAYDSASTQDPNACDEFTDASEISSWAKNAMAWAVDNGIISGKGNGILDPKGDATRAEAATVIYKFAKDRVFVRVFTLPHVYLESVEVEAVAID